MSRSLKIGLGGGCHWCTEGIFECLAGVLHVEQGWLSTRDDDFLSEGVIVHFDAERIPLEALIEIHLHTHSSTTDHSMRTKYRSAIYCFDSHQLTKAKTCLKQLQLGFGEKIVTKAYLFGSFKSNAAPFLNYLFNGPDKPFCKRHIHPKIIQLQIQYKRYLDEDKIALLTLN